MDFTGDTGRLITDSKIIQELANKGNKVVSVSGIIEVFWKDDCVKSICSRFRQAIRATSEFYALNCNRATCNRTGGSAE